jgi:hypothetical protein
MKSVSKLCVKRRIRNELIDLLSDCYQERHMPNNEGGTSEPQILEELVTLQSSDEKYENEDFEEENVFLEATFDETLMNWCNQINVESQESGLEKVATLAEELLLFFLIFNLTHKCMEHLLNMLRRNNVPGVPESMYFLKKGMPCAPTNLTMMEKGSFAYLGVIENLKFLFDKKAVIVTEGVKELWLNLKINIDGLPLYKSSKVGLWTILMLVEKVYYPVPIGVFCGIGKRNLTPFSRRIENVI